MSISILIPVYNAAATLEETLTSLRAQTEPTWELIAVDDGSTDRSAEILADYASRDPRIRLIRRAHKGIVNALNSGLAHCRGDLIARMDADDLCMPDRLRRQRCFLDAHPEIGLVSCRVRYGGDRERNRGFALYVDWVNELIDPESIYLARFVESPLVHPSVMFRKSLIEAHGGYRLGGYPEDYELWLRWLDAGVRMSKVDEELFTWCERSDRLSRIDPRYATDAFYAVKAEFLARWLKRKHIDEVIIWGAGRTSRQRAEHLAEHGIHIAAYIDVDPKKIGRIFGDRPVLEPGSLHGAASGKVVLAYVASRGARAQIADYLDRQGFLLGRDYLLAA